MTASKAPQSIFEHDDYKKYLNSWLEHLPKRHGELSKIATFLGVKNSLLSQIFGGSKHISLEQGLKLTNYLGLSDLEREYFILMLEENRAGTKALEDYFQKQRLKLRSRSKKLSLRLPTDQALSESDQAIFYSTWHYSAIRLLSSIPGFDNESAIAEKLQLSRRSVRERLEFLLRTGLCVEKNGKLQIGPSYTHLPAESPLVIRHHQNWRQKSLHHMEKMRTHDLCYSAPLTISYKDRDRVRERITSLLTEIKEIVKKTEPETLMCLGIDFLELIE